MLVYFGGCDQTSDEVEIEDDPQMTSRFNTDVSTQAVAVRVSVTGQEGSYQFNVTLQSPDTGCDQYADWWEIVDVEDELAYRRILAHSHVDEQPFARSGGPVGINKDDKIYIRGHMNNLGYGSLGLSGSVEEGFRRDTFNVSINLEKTDPLPDGCDF